MKMSELILGVGDENVKFQNLFDSMKNASTNKKGITTISFLTDAITTTELMDLPQSKYAALVLWLPRDKVELVLWLPRDKVEAAIAAGKVPFPAV